MDKPAPIELDKPAPIVLDKPEPIVIDKGTAANAPAATQPAVNPAPAAINHNVEIHENEATEPANPVEVFAPTSAVEPTEVANNNHNVEIEDEEAVPSQAAPLFF